jgi:hypothetical protein
MGSSRCDRAPSFFADRDTSCKRRKLLPPSYGGGGKIEACCGAMMTCLSLPQF